MIVSHDRAKEAIMFTVDANISHGLLYIHIVHEPVEGKPGVNLTYAKPLVSSFILLNEKVRSPRSQASSITG
jgi:hypothetical protein